MLQEAGVDCMDVSAGTHESLDMFVQPASFSPGCLVHLADAIKKVVNIPVIAVGRIVDPLLAESILLQGKADFVAMGRALIADPELPNKARDEKLDEIRPCLACRLCLDRIFQKMRVSCTVNAGFGQEGKCVILPSKKQKKVLIIGGGPSGLEAARIAALRGHQVLLYEREEKLGGQLRLASVPPYKQGISSLMKFLIGQVTKLGVEIHVGQKGTFDLVSEIKPDAVVVATGNLPVKPDIPGIQRSNVSLVTDVLSGKEKVGETIVIIGGGQVGCETADFLATIGKKVTILARHDVARDMEPLERKPLLRRLSDEGVNIYTNADVQEITDRGVAAKANGRNIDFDADSIIIATGFISNDELVKYLRREIPEPYVIGDCVEPRKLHEAIHEGFQVGLKL
jgi:NADPH-dependent 2,4-dienoyl-CoA reductase/sulfur reductase-like enzyme